MTVANPVTSNELVLRVKAPERDAFKKTKDEYGLTYTQYCLGVKEGDFPLIEVPAADQKAKHIPWVVVRLYLTAEQKAFLEADAERRGTTVSKAVRADIFQPPKNPVPPVKAKSLRVSSVVPDETRDALALVRDRPEFEYTKLMSEVAALVEIAGVLLKREALSKP